MEKKDVEKQLAEINRKLDFLTEQMEINARRQQEWQELKEDLNRIGIDLFQSAVTELDEVSHHFDSQDLLHLLKKLLRNTRNLSRLLDQIESVHDMLTDAIPIGRDAFIDLLYTLNELEQKGYFDFFRELLQVVDNVVTSFSPEDVEALADNVVTILQTVRELTQPDMLIAVNNAVSVYKNLDIHVREKISYWELFRSARTPEMRRGIAFGIQFLKNLAAVSEPANNGNHKKTISTTNE